ncbi:forkhead box protein M1 [Chanos chanos]|uniref:Forkhead box protein M1 n=1 Tax=Chanos chanos TaxID=29144 RepID=A0A6J2WKQ9_CHACN|nr:forkhead box protein M1 [Chanos chanos]
MRESPRRPLILKRRKLPFQRNEADVPHDEPDGLRQKEAPKPPSSQCFTDGIRIMDHPTMPDTQVVVIPKTADLQSVIGALTAKGKECGPQGPNKFILLSGCSNLEDGKEILCPPSSETPGSSHRSSFTVSAGDDGCATTGCLTDTKLLTSIKPLNKELDCSPLDDSLTNIQWLGRMSTDGLGPAPARKGYNKENQDSCPQLNQPSRVAEESQAVTMKDPQSERPPYSYMAMIQFAINSKKNRKMTLKEIYMWIEDHFPYFRNVAKPGWKNSIRHNLSLHDMFVRETTQDGKTSYWTIRPEANRCLTLDQVYKTEADPAASLDPQTVQVCGQQQQKRVASELKKTGPSNTERKMKPLLPRTDSYLVPIQLTPSLFLPSSAPLSISGSQQNGTSSTTSTHGGGKRVRIAPKVTQGDASSVLMCTPTSDGGMKEEPLCVSLSAEPSTGPPNKCRREGSSSRRKQRLVQATKEEPVLLFPDSTFFDSGLASDISAFQETREMESNPQPNPDHDSPCRAYTFKTPIKSRHPASSTPSKPPTSLVEPWRITPLGKESSSRGVLDFSPIRTPGGPVVTPQRHDHMSLSFSSTPFKELPLFNSPRELLTSTRPSPHTSTTPTCARELQVGAGGASNRSLAEGLVLDTMNDSLSKILVDISFSGLEDEELGMANISWSQLIPELK